MAAFAASNRICDFVDRRAFGRAELVVVLDFEFILGRTLVVATISLIVVVAFILLEWLLGTVLSNVSHATGVAANAALALVLGLSMRYIHRRVDTFVDSVLFHKRHEDERALIDFSNPAVNENDEAILAFKTWHRAIDPHRYHTVVSGALALPMLARGRLDGILLLGERAGGEAYAPDEVEALSQFAHGVGSALDRLLEKSGDGSTDIKRLIVELTAEVRALPDRLSGR